MPVNPNALNAYSAAAGLAKPSAAGTAAAASGQETGFGTMVKNALDTITESQQASEQTTMQAVQGQADLTDVVTAVSNAEVTLQTAVAVRDKVVEAYQNVMRMPI